MNPQLQQAVQEAYARRTGGGQMPQQQAALQPAPQQPTSGYSGGTEGVPVGNGTSIPSDNEIKMIAAKALAKKLNDAGKIA